MKSRIEGVLTAHEELSQAESSSAVCEVLLRRILELMPVSGVHVMPFGATGEEPPRSALYQRGGDLEAARRRLPRALQLLLAEPKLPALFSLPGRLLRVEEALGWDSWLKSPVYQDHFRHLASARQLVVGLVDAAGAPRGFMAVCRAEQELPFDAREEGLVLACREEAERALAPFAVAPDWSKPLDEIVEALAVALPVAAVLVGERGRVLWMNREAELRLGAVGLSVGPGRFYASVGAALADVIALGLRELARPGALLANECRPAWLAEGETVVARRVAQPGAPLSALVCLSTPGFGHSLDCEAAKPRPVPDLTTREGEIAALAAEGFSVVTIAHRLGIAESTVSSHLKRVYKKLGVCSRVELAARLIRAVG